MFGRRKRQIACILVVEDDPLIAFDTEHMLGDAGYDVIATVDRVADALAVLARDSKVDLVLADINLADGSGVDVARAARAKDIPVLFVTGSCPVEARALAAGCLAKPYATRDLGAAIAAIDTVLQGGKPPRRLPAGFSLFLEAAA